MDKLVFDLVSLLDANLKEDFEERAGIMEFDGGLSRVYAECLALLDLYSRHPLSVLGLSVHKTEGGQYVLTRDPSLLRQLGIRSMGSAELVDVINDLGGVVVLSPPRK